MASLTEVFTAIADAIRSKASTSQKYKPADMAEAIMNITTMSGDAVAVGEGLANRTLETLDLGTAESIAPYGLVNVGALKVTGSKVTGVGAYGMRGYNEYSDVTQVLTEVYFPAAVTLGQYAFAYNGVLQKVTLSDDLTEIKQYAFYQDPKLTELKGATKVTSIGQYAFYQCALLEMAALPDTLTTIGQNAFNGCTAIALTALPSGITSIGAYAFSGCTKLTLTELPSGLTYINNGTFYNCPGVALTALPDGITSIGTSAFYKTGIVSLTIPDTVKTIGQYAFEYCTALEDVYIPALTSQSTYTFAYCTSLKKVVFSEGATLVSSYYFYGCTALEEVVFPDTFANIYTYAFYNCSKLKLTELPRKLQTLAGYAFYNCSSVSFQYLPDTITGVYNNTLQNCKGLTVLRFHSKPANGINSNSFTGCSNLKDIYVPWASGAVSNAPWGATNATVHYDTLYPVASVSVKTSANVSVKETSYDCNDLLTKLDQDGYETTAAISDLTWSATALDGVTIDASTGILTLASPSKNSTVTITATSTEFGTFTSTLTFVSASYSINMNNGQWVDTGTKVDGNTVYQSDAGSYHIDSGTSTAIITIIGYSKFVVYIRSYAESGYDYTVASQLDTAASRDGTSVQTTSNNQSQTQYYKAEYAISDANEHTIQIMYSKDSSSYDGDDRGYFYVAESECE